ncbi:hypothetical protein OIU35_24440 [Boseaceae bacterium BT-24-1]|nr:hypothetical protein [Boseaceae bacterium BT-24-1]
MVKVIEAQALITAKDGTGQAFASVASKFETLSKAGEVVARSAARRVAEVGRTIAGVTQAMTARIEDLGRKGRTIDNLTRSMGRLAESRTAFREAETHVRSLAREMAASAEPSRQLARNYEQAQRQVRAASAAFDESRNAAVAAKRAMVDLGLPLTGLGRQQAEIRERILGTTKAIQQQGRAAPHLRSSFAAAATAERAPVTPRPGVAQPGSGLPEAAASIGILGTARDTVVSGMNVDTERSQARQAGWTDKEVETLEHRANRFAAQYGLAPATAMNIIREARPTFGGDLQQTLTSVPDFFAVLTAMRQKAPQSSEADHGRQLGMMIKAGEILGYSSEPAKLKEYADFMTKMTQVHGSALRGEEILNFAKSGKSAGSAASFEFLSSVLPTMLPELGGDRLGTALMTLRQALVGGKMKKRAAEAMEEYGLVDPSGVIATADDDVKGVRPEAVKGSKIAERDPLEWVRSVLLPAMDEKGVKPADRAAVLSTMFSDRNAEYIINLMMEQMQRLQKDRATVEKAKGLPGVDQALKDDPYLAVARVKGSLQNVGAALSDPVMEPLKTAADGAANSLNSLADTARDHRTATGVGVAGGAIAGGALAGHLTQGGGALLRFGGMAAGTAAGAVAGGLALPLLTHGFYDLVSGGYQPVKGDRDEVAPGEAHNFSQKRRRFYHEALQGETDAVRRRFAPTLDEAGIIPLGAPAEGRVMTMPRATALSSVGPGSLEAVVKPDQITAKLEGQAQLGVEVTVAPSADFVASVVKKVLSQVGHIGIDGSGPGSTGRSMPEAAAPTGSSMGPR